MTQLSEWTCSQCGKSAIEDPIIGIPVCNTPDCAYYNSIIPNFIH
jgi:hypothetical protein